MNWINNVVRPKIRGLWQKREMPENLWVKCPETGQMVFHRDSEADQFVVPGSGYHMRIGAEARLKGLFDGGKFEVVPIPDVAVDPLKFRDQKRYSDRLKEARAKTGMSDAMLTGVGTLDGLSIVAAVQDFSFMGGSLGMAAGEAIIAGMSKAVELKIPYILFVSSGGARMQEGILSLMQMPRTTVARAAPARGEAALYRGAHQSHDRRRYRILRDAGRHPHRRARRADRLRRPACDRANHPGEASGRLPAVGIPARARHDRHGGAPA